MSKELSYCIDLNLLKEYLRRCRGYIRDGKITHAEAYLGQAEWKLREIERNYK